MVKLLLPTPWRHTRGKDTAQLILRLWQFANTTPRPIYPRRMNPDTYRIWGCKGPTAGLDVVKNRKIILPLRRLETRTTQPVAYVTPAPGTGASIQLLASGCLQSPQCKRTSRQRHFCRERSITHFVGVSFDNFVKMHGEKHVKLIFIFIWVAPCANIFCSI
jgi:hypothetical protein